MLFRFRLHDLPFRAARIITRFVPKSFRIHFIPEGDRFVFLPWAGHLVWIVKGIGREGSLVVLDVRPWSASGTQRFCE